MKNTIQLTVDSLDGKKEINFEIKNLINGGHSARDQSSIQTHIDEVKKLNFPVPHNIPTFLPLSNNMVTTETTIQVQHDQTSGEVEFILLLKDGEWYVSIGSDHTDRNLGVFSIPASKQMYPNFIAPVIWPVKDVLDHWDEIQMKLWIVDDGKRNLYQSGTFKEILPFSFWIRKMEEFNLNKSGSAIMCGTIPILNELRYGEKVEYEMFDPILKRKIYSYYKLFILMPPIE